MNFILQFLKLQVLIKEETIDITDISLMLYYIIFIKYKYICIIHFILLKLNYINLENP